MYNRRMSVTLERRLEIYADLTVKIALNVQPGQRLLIIGPLASGGASLEAAPFVEKIAASAYAAGSPLVETIWGNEALQVARFKYAPRDSFGEFSAWLPHALEQHVEGGNAILSVYARPDLSGRTAARDTVQKPPARHARVREHLEEPDELAVSRRRTQAGAARISTVDCQRRGQTLGGNQPSMPAERADPMAAWGQHLTALGSARY